MKKAVVTGVSWDTGIGFAVTKQLIEDGYFVYAVYHSKDSNAKEILEEQYADTVLCLQCDFTDRKAVGILIEKLKEVNLDAIVNNAGAFSGGEDINHYDISEWDRVFAVNVTAPLLLCTGLKSVLNPHAVIVNMVSSDGRKGSFSSISYAASKAALINLTDSLAINFGYDEKKIRVTSVCPGWVKTFDESDPASSEMVPFISRSTGSQLCPLERFATPEEIANVVSFLLSDKASFISGGCVPVDGGYSAVGFDLYAESGKDFVGYHPEEAIAIQMKKGSC
ncbi:MAG: SDR family oxidoreductase [Candidatus Gastranaerophilales bacterium]|nr:SDR family oxidoreductase [Candidatus Gastranaerophilales bacterium]